MAMSLQHVASGSLLHSFYHADAQAQSADYIEVGKIVWVL